MIVEKNQERIASLVMDMLSLSKDREPKRSLVDLRNLIEDGIELIQAQAHESHIEVDWERPEEAYILLLDAEGSIARS